MSLALVVDMNLTAEWIPVLVAAGFDAVHWSQIGSVSAPDHEIMSWAAANSRTVFTLDLDFGAILATTRATSPSVVLLRGGDVLPDSIGATVISEIRKHEPELLTGALLVIDLRHTRVRILPLTP